MLVKEEKQKYQTENNCLLHHFLERICILYFTNLIHYLYGYFGFYIKDTTDHCLSFICHLISNIYIIFIKEYLHSILPKILSCPPSIKTGLFLFLYLLI